MHRRPAVWNRLASLNWFARQNVLAGYKRPRGILAQISAQGTLLILLAGYAVAQGYAMAILPVSLYLFVGAPLVALLFLVVWVLPTTNKGPIKLLVTLFAIYPWIVFVWPNYLAFSIAGLPWISLRRMVLAPMAICLLIALSMSPRFRAELWQRTSEARPLAVGVIAFAIIQLLSVAMSGAPGASLKFMFDAQCAWTVTFFVGCYAFAEEGRIESWMRAMCFIALLLAAVGIAEWYHGAILWAYNIPSFFEIDAETVKATLSGASRFGKYRVTGTSSQPLAFAEIFAVLSPFVLHFMFSARSIWTKTLLAGVDFALLIAIAGTDSRLGFLGFGVAHLVYLAVFSLRRFRANRSDLISPLIVYGYPAILAIAFILSLTLDAIRLRVWGGGAAQYSNDAREEQFRMAVGPWLRSPIIGHGPARSADVLGYVTQAGLPSVDSYVLTISLEYGLAGFLCFFFLIGYGIYKAAAIGTGSKDQRALMALPLCVSLVVYLEVKLVLSQNDNTTTLFLLLGALSGLAYRLRPATCPTASIRDPGMTSNNSSHLMTPSVYGQDPLR